MQRKIGINKQYRGWSVNREIKIQLMVTNIDSDITQYTMQNNRKMCYREDAEKKWPENFPWESESTQEKRKCAKRKKKRKNVCLLKETNKMNEEKKLAATTAKNRLELNAEHM